MSSRALKAWQTRGRTVLDEVEAAHALVGGARRARAFARQQITQAYVVLLASQFQRFCRDLHTECIQALTDAPAYVAVAPVLQASLATARRLDSGNANAANIQQDFARFALAIWDAVSARDPRTPARRQKLELLNAWRNAIAHQDFRSPQLDGRETPRIAEVRAWRSACNSLAVDFDAILRLSLNQRTGVFPW